MPELQQLTLIAPRRQHVRPWWPASWRRSVSGREVELIIPAPVRRRCKAPKKLTPSEWSVLRRRLPSADASPGPYRPELARYAAQVMDTWALPWVREVWLCGVDQASKTNTMLSCIGWSIDQAPGNIFYQMPDEGSSNKIMGQKLIPMFRESPSLAMHLSPRADDTSLAMVKLSNGVSIMPSWSGSPTSTATFTATYTFTDEVDKARMVGKESSPIDRIRKRIRTKRFGKNFFASSPAGMWIYKGAMSCVQVWEAGARCPECGELIRMDEDHVIIPDGATEESIKAEPETVAYACNACGSLWDERARRHACERGGWVCIKGQDVSRPVDVGFTLPAFPLPDVSLAEIAVIILRARAGDVSARRDLAHSIKAVDYQEDAAAIEGDFILRLRDDRPEGLVPSVPIAAITAVADMQKRGLWFSIRAWGFGLEQESWLLRAGYVDSWESLRRLFYETEFQDVHGGRYVITLRGIDSGGGESEQYVDISRTGEAYLFACANSGIVLFKGVRTLASPYRMTVIDRLPGTNKPLPSTPQLYTLNSKHYKDRLAAKIMVDPNSPGAWHLHSGYTAAQLEMLHRDPATKMDHNLGEFARQMAAEGKDEKGGFWVNPKNRPNHYWDAAYMEMALVDIAQVKFWKQPDLAAQGGRRVLSTGI